MAQSIKHRGPDDDGIFVSNTVGLASTRLSILDLSENGHMPMHDPASGMVIVHNGEVYNYKEIRKEIGSRDFRTETDTEVIVKAYAKWGTDCLSRLNGIFAFAIWDPREERLFCARDRLGVKPFLYSQSEGRLTFGSEAKALFAAGIAPQGNRRAISDFLVRGIYEHNAETFFENVVQLPAGHMMTVDNSGLVVSQYWDLEENENWSKDRDRTDVSAYRDTQEAFLALVEDSLKLQLRSDVPIAVNASGGLDSTLMLSVIDKLSGMTGERQIFSYYYGEAQYDERPQVEQLAKVTGWQAEFFKLAANDVPAMAEEAIHYQEQPFPGVVALARHNLIKQSRGFGAKVLLEGQGGDEISAGYQYVMGPHIFDLMEAGRADLASDEILGFGRKNNLSDADSLKKCMSGLMAYQGTGWAADGNRFVRPECLSADFAVSTNPVTFDKPFRSHLKNMQYRDLFYTKLPRILRSVDRASMSYGREIRVPLLDHRLVEFAFNAPASHKIKDGAQRDFMRAAIESHLPTTHSNVPKIAVVDPQREWLQGHLSDWVQDIIGSRSFIERGVFNPKAVQAEFERFKTGKARTSFQVWQWVNMELWYRHWGI